MKKNLADNWSQALNFGSIVSQHSCRSIFVPARQAFAIAAPMRSYESGSTRLKACLSASGLPRATKTNTRSANRWGIRALATRSLPGLSSKSISKIINRFGSRSVRLLREVFGSLKYQPPPFRQISVLRVVAVPACRSKTDHFNARFLGPHSNRKSKGKQYPKSICLAASRNRLASCATEHHLMEWTRVGYKGQAIAWTTMLERL